MTGSDRGEHPGGDERTPEDHERWIRTSVEASKHDPSYGEAAAGWAVAEIDRLRARVAELDRGEHPGSDDESEVRDVVRYARSQGFPSGSTVPTRVAAGLLDEIDRLRARVAELETAGDNLADSADEREDIPSAIRAWRAVRGER